LGDGRTSAFQFVEITTAQMARPAIAAMIVVAEGREDFVRRGRIGVWLDIEKIAPGSEEQTESQCS
jgi:hypothetical protein